MDCDKCGKPAKVHLTQLVGGQVKKVALCNECAAEGGVTDPTGFALADLLMGGTHSVTPATMIPHPKQSGSKNCPECGFSVVDLKRIRRLGCAHCYIAFRDEVKDMIRGMHKGMTHCGKVPDGLMEAHQRKLRLKDLGEKLDQAVKTENYEEAANLRDEIRKLEDSLKPTGSKS